jgi:FPC/CPF motif-containing protein YcgG
MAVESVYLWRDSRLHPTGRSAPDAVLAHDTFRATVLSSAFPCVVGATTIRAGRYHFGRYDTLGGEASLRALAGDLTRFVHTTPLRRDAFATFVASYREPGGGSEELFERLLWRTLQGIHELDDPGRGWDPGVSSDPSDVDFSFSFAGRAFFAVGMHPAASRWSRRTPWATIVFNAHAQFEVLRHSGRLEPVRRAIRNRDVRLQGMRNPALSDFGEESEAAQYAGRLVEPGWRCPLRVREQFRSPHGSGDAAGHDG